MEAQNNMANGRQTSVALPLIDVVATSSKVVTTEQHEEPLEKRTMMDGTKGASTLNNITSGSNNISYPKNQQVVLTPTTYYSDKVPYITHTYPTTLSFLFFLHIIYFYQYKRRKSYSEVCCTYGTVIRDYKFYRMFLAMVSYYPTTTNARGHSRRDVEEEEQRSLLPTSNIYNTVEDNENIASSTPTRQAIRDTLLEPFQAPNGILSGFPLLTYTSHMLWSIRALESQFTSIIYLRFLIFLAILHTLFYCTYYRYCIMTFPFRYSTLIHKPWTTMTSMVIFLVSFFKYQYPFINIQIIPFFLYTTTWYNEANDSITSVMIYVVEYIICCIIFYCLSKARHSSACFFGLFTSFLTFPTWNALIHAFVKNTYWSNCVLIWVFALCILSIKHSDHEGDGNDDDFRQRRRPTSTWIPCIDYVSWSSTSQEHLLQQQPIEGEQNDRSSQEQENNPAVQPQEEEGEEDEFLSFTHNTTSTTQELEYQPRETNTTTTARSRARHNHTRNRDVASTTSGNMNGTTLGYQLTDGHDSD